LFEMTVGKLQVMMRQKNLALFVVGVEMPAMQ
jgi:hypothetical protein